MNNALYNIKNGEYNRFCEEQPHNEQCECCDQQCCPCEPSESTEQVQSDWNQKDSTQPDYIRNKPVIPNQQIQSDWDQLDDSKKDFIKNKPVIPDAQVNADWNASSGAAQILNKPTIPTVPEISTDISADATSDTKTTSPKAVKTFVEGKGYTTNTGTITSVKMNGSIVSSSGEVDLGTVITDVSGKADKISGATNGNFAALDSNGNLTDSGHKHSDYLTSHQDLSDYVQKSSTPGLVKNDGTVDTTQYLSQHQDISGKEDKMTIEAGSGTTLSAVVGKYYRFTNVGTLVVTLPTITGATTLQMITFSPATGATPNVTFTTANNETVYYQQGYAIEPNGRYEITAVWNGSEWTITSIPF